MNSMYAPTKNQTRLFELNTFADSLRVALPSQLQNLACGFAPISLEQMEAVALLNRVDTKFLMSARQMLDVLSQVQSEYWMLSIQGQRLNHYRTLYFDTPDFAMYHAHVNGQGERYKVRSREYTDTQLSFLEIKHKTRKGRTIKDRVPTSQPVWRMTPEVLGWLQSIAPVDSDRLEPKLINTFTRITLVNKQRSERVTLDTDLTFHAETGVISLDGLAIAEVKRDASYGASTFLKQMQAQRIRPLGFSKYVVGVALLYDQVKKNALKPKLRMIDKMMKGSISYDYAA